MRTHNAAKPNLPAADKASYMTHFYAFVLVYPDGEVSVDSLSPAHTLSSVPSPSSVEALSPYSLQVSHCFQLFVLLSFQLTCISDANLTTVTGCEYFARVSPSLVRSFHPDGVQTLTAALCFRIATHTYTLETLINKSLKHLVTLIICCQSELCPAPSLNKRC